MTFVKGRLAFAVCPPGPKKRKHLVCVGQLFLISQNILSKEKLRTLIKWVDKTVVRADIKGDTCLNWFNYCNHSNSFYSQETKVAGDLYISAF